MTIQDKSRRRRDNSPKLLASYFTIAGDVLPMSSNWSSPYPLMRRAEAAARAGYIGLGLSVDDLASSEELYGYAGMRDILCSNGMEHLEFETLMNWFADGPEREESDMVRRRLFEAADALGANHIKVGGGPAGTDPANPRFVDEFGKLCQEAAAVGTQIFLELTVMSNIGDLPSGIALVESAGAANGGLILDIWHVVRGNIPFESIAALPPGCLKHVELNDAAQQMIGSMLEDTICRRRLPGEGSFDVPGFLMALDRAGYEGLYGVEIISDIQRRLAPEDAARLSYDATVNQFKSAKLIA